MGYFFMQNMHMRFCLAIIFFCRASHSEGWIGKVLNCIKVKRTEWALRRWHRSRGESAINVNAFSVSSTSSLRPHLLLPKKVLIDSCGTSSPEHICCLYTKRILLSMRCELECRSSWSQSASAHFYSPFHSLDLVQINRSVGLYVRCTGIFLMANSSWTFPCVEGRKNMQFRTFFLLFLSYIFILSRPIELIYSIYSIIWAKVL